MSVSIVRLRRKHSSGYLCTFLATKSDPDSDKWLESTLITRCSLLMESVMDELMTHGEKISPSDDWRWRRESSHGSLIQHITSTLISPVFTPGFQWRGAETNTTLRLASQCRRGRLYRNDERLGAVSICNVEQQNWKYRMDVSPFWGSSLTV